MKQHVAGHVKSGNIWKDPKDETPAELKARLIVEKTAEKERRKKMDAEIKAANLILARVGPALVALDAMLARPGMAMVATILKDPLVAAAESFHEYEEAARNVVSSDGATTLDGLPDLKEISNQIASCRKQLALATQMLGTLARVRQ
jgi:hypothetical protein